MCKTVTMEGIAPGQPGVCVSTTRDWRSSEVRLSVFRAYDSIPNSWGGFGVYKPCDGHGKTFPSAEDATKFCLERGYLRPFYSSLRAVRKAAARDPRKMRLPTVREVFAA